MDRRDKVEFLKEFFTSQTDTVPSKTEINQIIDLKFGDGKFVLDFDDEYKRIEVLALLKNLPVPEVVDYLAVSKNFEEMVLKSPLMADAINQVKLKREILSRGVPGAKDVFGTCPHCKYDKLKRSERAYSGDENMLVKFTCTRCRRTWNG